MIFSIAGGQAKCRAGQGQHFDYSQKSTAELSLSKAGTRSSGYNLKVRHVSGLSLGRRLMSTVPKLYLTPEEYLFRESQAD